MVWLAGTEVRQELNELDQTELEVPLTDELLLPVSLGSPGLHQVRQVRQLIFLVNFLVGSSHRLQGGSQTFIAGERRERTSTGLPLCVSLNVSDKIWS